MQCEIKDCERHANTRKFGILCLMHYKRMSKNGCSDDIKTKERNKNRKQRESAKCKFCDREVGRIGAKGMCNKHYQMDRLHGNPLYRDDKKNKPGISGYIRHNYGKGYHRTVVENHIGRKLVRGEVVHHIDFVKTNNKIENLYLCKNASEHAKIHQQYNRLRKEIGEIVAVVFENGIYRASSI